MSGGGLGVHKLMGKLGKKLRFMEFSQKFTGTLLKQLGGREFNWGMAIGVMWGEFACRKLLWEISAGGGTMGWVSGEQGGKKSIF